MSFEPSSHLLAYLSPPACAEILDRDDLTIEAYDLAEHEWLLNDHPLPSAWESPT